MAYLSQWADEMALFSQSFSPLIFLFHTKFWWKSMDKLSRYISMLECVSSDKIGHESWKKMEEIE